MAAGDRKEGRGKGATVQREGVGDGLAGMGDGWKLLQSRGP
jgi:hypothetical protein